MKCEQIKKLLVAYLDGEVTPVKRSLIELHLSTCQQCQEELKGLTTTREELRQALRAKAAEVEPSQQVWDVVRQRITTKGSFWEQLSSILSRPVWRAVIPVVLVVVLAVGVLWGAGILPQFGGMAPPPAPAPTPTIPAPTVPPPVITIPPAPTPTPAPTPAPVPTFEVSAVTTKTGYLPGEAIEIEFSFTNKATEPVTFVSFPPQIEVIKPAPYKVFRTFPAGTETKFLNPKEVVTWAVTWDQKDNSGQQVAPGWYYIEVKVTTSKGTPPAASGYTQTPIKLLIQHSQGAMEKTIGVNQSQTVNGITIILERVELTATGMKVFAFNTPPDYRIPIDSSGKIDPQTDLWSVRAMAEYSIDGGVTTFAGLSGIRFLDNGMTHTWDDLDPVAKTAKELKFIIARLGDPLHKYYWQGPWEFEVQLR